MRRRFAQLDVFAEEPLLGNPLAVVVDADGLDDRQMQSFASWTNLSETTFLLPPSDSSADYRVRIFTPTEELPFAGHPTLGSAHAWLAHAGTPRQPGMLIQECGVGLVKVRKEGPRLSFEAPQLLRSGVAEESIIIEACDSLGISRSAILSAAWVDNGPGWLGLLLGSAEEVLAVKPRTMNLSVGIVGPYPAGAPFAYEVRAFYSGGGTTLEDPVTGSLNASLAQWLVGDGRVKPPYTASQGTAMARAGRVHISTDESGALWVGGNVVSCIEGFVDI